MKTGTAIIIGAGPAGLTAAIELQRHTGIKPILIEASHEIGGISRTVRYNGNRMDIGGHRFFSKSDRVMNWWMELMPLEAAPARCAVALPRQQRTPPVCNRGADPADEDLVMLVRQRKSRIYFLRRFFDYPIRLTGDTLRRWAWSGSVAVGHQLHARGAASPAPTRSRLRTFSSTASAAQLYLTFFKSYTEKVWGVPCDEISAEWGAQRIKGLSLRRRCPALSQEDLCLQASRRHLGQKETETSLIEKFLYPKFGPGQLWEHAADRRRARLGGEIHKGIAIDHTANRGRQGHLRSRHERGRRASHASPATTSSPPCRCASSFARSPLQSPPKSREVSDGLMYRDFITVGLLVKKLKRDRSRRRLPLTGQLDLYPGAGCTAWPSSDLQQLEPLSGGRSDDKIWIGLEYFCNDTDHLWKLSDEEMVALAVGEVARIGIIKAEDVEDAHVVRVPKTYPAYFGTYDRFDVIRELYRSTSRTSSWWAATACTSTTTRTTPC